MPDREAERRLFLSRAGWGAARLSPLTGDASGRRYTRLDRDGARAVLMDADPATGEEVAPFLRAAAHLREADLSAPDILAHDTERGFVLLEDFGDAIFARLIAADPSLEETLYAAATDLLVALHTAPVPDWAARYDAAAMAAALRPAWDWYIDGQARPPSRDWLGFEAAFAAELAASEAPFVLLHRDYHAENLVWLPKRAGVARVGLLDFQDALAGHPAYDLASLLQDARRDVDPALEDQMIARFLAATGHPGQAFRRAYALQAAQRHLRILGIFAHLAANQGKPAYLALVPRVRAALERDLSHPDLAGLRDMAHHLLPAEAPA